MGGRGQGAEPGLGADERGQMKGVRERVQGLKPGWRGLGRMKLSVRDEVELPQLMAGWSVAVGHQVLTWVLLLHVPAQGKKHTVYEKDRQFGLEHYDRSPLIHSYRVEGGMGVSIQLKSCSGS